jgi:hypothetical protein
MPAQLMKVINHEKKELLIDCKPWVIFRSIENVGTVTTRNVRIAKATVIIVTLI